MIDTSTSIELLALSVDGKIYRHSKDEGISHSVTMFQNLSSLLSQASIRIDDIKLIGVGTGPGSFTGIRIAVSTARMFSQILKIPLVGLKSTEIYAASAGQPGIRTVLVAFDAKKSRVFGGIYRADGTSTEEMVEPGDYPMEDLLGLFKDRTELICAGDGCGKYIDVIEKISANNGFEYKYLDNFIPEGGAAIDLALREYQKSPGQFTDYNKVVPFYSRMSDAEIAKYAG